MKIETKKLEGAALDWAVAKCEGATNLRLRPYAGRNPGPPVWVCDWAEDWEELANYSPSTDWAVGGPIIERIGGTLWSAGTAGWRYKARYDSANDREGPTQSGFTPLIAAMRCYVASKLGSTVDIPDEVPSA